MAFNFESKEKEEDEGNGERRSGKKVAANDFLEIISFNQIIIFHNVIQSEEPLDIRATVCIQSI